VDDLLAMKSEDVGLVVCAIVSKIFNLCGHDPPTSQTDGQTTCNSNTVLCTVVHRAVKKERKKLMLKKRIPPCTLRLSGGINRDITINE